MQFAFTDEQDELRHLARDVFGDLSPESEVRRLMETDEGFDRKVWKQLADIGLVSLAIPEEYGGAGCGLVELGIVLEEAGAVLLCAPYLSSVVLATSIILQAREAGDLETAARLLPALGSGDRTAALALTEGSGHWDPNKVETRAQLSGDGWSIFGEKSFVLDGHTADDLLVVARTQSGLSVFAVDAAAVGMARHAPQTLDQTRRYAAIIFSATPATLVGPLDEAASIVDRALAVAATGLACEQVGGAGRVLDMAVEYAKVREQFGRPIGSFQAIKHTCADMLLEVESARSAAYYALWTGAAGSPDFPLTSSVAQAYCSDAFFHCAAKNIQVHGGIGFTWEHPAHLYLKRAKNSQMLFGDSSYHRELVAQRVGM